MHGSLQLAEAALTLGWEFPGIGPLSGLRGISSI